MRKYGISVVDELLSGAVMIKIIAFDEEKNELAQVQSVSLTTTDNQWRILNASISLPENASKILVQIGLFEGEGVYYLDAIWIAEGATPTKFNLTRNSSFYWYDEAVPSKYWKYSQKNNVSNMKNGANYLLRFKGDPDLAVTASQEHSINGKAGDVLVFGANSKADCSASGNDGHRFYGIKVYLIDEYQNILQTKEVSHLLCR